jgi:hypothetical protein
MRISSGGFVDDQLSARAAQGIPSPLSHLP